MQVLNQDNNTSQDQSQNAGRYSVIECSLWVCYRVVSVSVLEWEMLVNQSAKRGDLGSKKAIPVAMV